MKKFLTLALVAVICLSLSIDVFAATASISGDTENGDDGSLETSASLRVDPNRGEATTTCSRPEFVTIGTTINYYFTNSMGHEQCNSTTGNRYVIVGGDSGKGTYAKSYHTVNGGEDWGSWSYSLRANAF